MNNNKNYNIENLDILKEKLQKLIKKKHDIKLRSQANLENIKKKSAHTIIKIQKEHLKEFKNKITDIIKKIDQVFEEPYEQKCNQHAVIEGIQLIKKSLINTLKKINK